jgi:hypothetical protein
MARPEGGLRREIGVADRDPGQMLPGFERVAGQPPANGGCRDRDAAAGGQFAGQVRAAPLRQRHAGLGRQRAPRSSCAACATSALPANGSSRSTAPATTTTTNQSSSPVSPSAPAKTPSTPPATSTSTTPPPGPTLDELTGETTKLLRPEEPGRWVTADGPEREDGLDLLG